MSEKYSEHERLLDSTILSHYGMDKKTFDQKTDKSSEDFGTFMKSNKAFIKTKNTYGEPIWLAKTKKGTLFMFMIYLGFKVEYNPAELFTSIPDEIRDELSKITWWSPVKSGYQVGKKQSLAYWELAFEYEYTCKPNENYPATIELLEEQCSENSDQPIINDKKFIKYYDDNIASYVDDKSKIGMIDFETTNLGYNVFDEYSGTDQTPLVCVIDDESIVNDLLVDGIDIQLTFNESIRKMAKDIEEKTKDMEVLYAYNMSFEDKVLRKMGLDTVADKLRDLAPPFRARMVYHKGSFRKWSLKHTHQLITGKNAYENLNMKNGFAALVESRAALYNTEPNTQLIDNLVEYCTVDTMIMYEYLTYYTNIYNDIKSKMETNDDNNN